MMCDWMSDFFNKSCTVSPGLHCDDEFAAAVCAGKMWHVLSEVMLGRTYGVQYW